MSRLEFRVLGPVEALHGGQRLDIGHPRQRAVLAVLLLDLNHVVSAQQLIDRVWGEDPPVTVRNVLYGYVAGLRTALVRAAAGNCMLARRAGGYVLAADEDQLDLCWFRRLAVQARAADRDEDAAQQLSEALALWRGEALTGLGGPWLEGVRQALSRQRMDAVACANDIRLRQGEHAALAGELSELIARNPADERLAGQLILALYRSGRPGEALRWFERTRLRLADELGADAGPELQALHRQILAEDPALAFPGRVGRQSELTPRELPADVEGFAGRAGQLAALDRLLAVPASESGPVGRAGDSTVRTKSTVVISALSGTAGVGKTALAIRWAHRAAERFPDGQLYVTLRGYDPAAPVPASEALAGFLRALGVASADIPPHTEERAARYRSLVAGRRILVVIDNARSAEQVRPLLPGTASCVTVVTSRDSLAGLVARDGAWRLELDLMPEPDAVGLLRELIGARVDEEPAAAALLAAQCARLPLALRLAAELAVSRPEVPLADLARQLADQRIRLDLLDAGGDSQSAVRAVFSWSYRQLTTDMARAFRQLGLHPGASVEPNAAAALLQTSPVTARRLLDQLARASLMQAAGPGRYGMHDLLRSYARELAASQDGEQESAAALARLVDYYLHAAAAAMDALLPGERSRRPELRPPALPAGVPADNAAALPWLDAEWFCLGAVIAEASARGWAGKATQLADTLSWYLLTSGHAPEALRIYDDVLHAAVRSADRASEAIMLARIGAVCSYQGRSRDAASHLQRALTIYRDIGDQAGQARALTGLGDIGPRPKDGPDPVSCYRRAAAIYRRTGDLAGQVTALTGLACGLTAQGLHQEAARQFHRALQLSHDFGQPEHRLHALCHLSLFEIQLGRYQQADAHLREYLALCRGTGNRNGEALALADLAWIDLEQDRLSRARQGNLRALAQCDEVGDHRIRIFVLANLGVTETRLGRHEEAAGHQRQALELAQASHNRECEADALNGLGELCRATGHPDQAIRHHTRALDLASQLGYQPEQARAHEGLGHCHQASGDHQAAHRHWQQALTCYRTLGAPHAARVHDILTADQPTQAQRHH
jgi:DNA-binding SARP family transcriptional activator/tetratricopeptide (TPR) repeat protein